MVLYGIPLHHGAQLSGAGLGVELHPGLFKNPGFDAFMAGARHQLLRVLNFNTLAPVRNVSR